MQVVIDKCFLLNPEKKIGAYPSYRFREKRKNRLTSAHSNSEKMTSPIRKLGYSNNRRLKFSFRLSKPLFIKLR